VELLSTGGTAKHLKDAGLTVIDVSDYTGFPEMFDGRVKTLHPKVHGGLLQRRDNDEDKRNAKKHEHPLIDLVVVNLYPFEQTVAKKDVTLEEAIENIDIGGPSMLRSAAKNHRWVTVITDPADYSVCAGRDEGKRRRDQPRHPRAPRLQGLPAHLPTIPPSPAYLNKEQSHSQDLQCLSLPLLRELRYGDNPHQKTSLYGNFGDYFVKLHGKDLSYTNVLDIQAAAEIALEFRRPTVAILKHTNPCGVGCADEDLREAWQKAFETDKQAPFGGVIVVNRSMTLGLAKHHLRNLHGCDHRARFRCRCPCAFAERRRTSASSRCSPAWPKPSPSRSSAPLPAA
jgi:phosphoribosylaminoimidazolecarboxamide formyltransferase/IMP cyclohydrolase